MKKFIVVSICLLFFVSLHAQTVTVKKQQDRVKGENTDGYGTDLEGKKEDISLAWSKFLKEVGKAKSLNDVLTISEPALGATVYPKGILYATSSGDQEKGRVWIGLKEAEWTVNDIGMVNAELEKLVYRFGIKFYKDKIQLQIDEAQRASDAVDKQKQRLLNQSKDLVLKLGNNDQEKIRLEKAVEANKLEHEVLLVKIVVNN
ncbi:MAG TPA: hypothetical protein VIT44_02220, partial [Cyclobacteriaceae bacterium]